MADGSHYYTIGDTFGIGRHAVCDAVHAGVDAIVGVLFRELVRWPEDEIDRQQIRAAFYQMESMPSVAGKYIAKYIL